LAFISVNLIVNAIALIKHCRDSNKIIASLLMKIIYSIF
jgi:hypothetical protein